MDIDILINALENKSNENIIKLDFDKIAKIKNDILQQLGVPNSILKKLHKSLKDYRFVDELPELEFGRYIRWINLKDVENIKLQVGGVICDIKVGDDGIILVCKNFMHKYYQIYMNEILIFQKLTEQEKVILKALKYLDN
tara:strand:+ start:9105 stop:9524 length:420 start_codon:yes stop_codon:yes gene_type:complete